MSQKSRYKEQPAPTTGGLLPLPKNSAQNFGNTEVKQRGLQNIGLYFDRYIRFADLDWQMVYEVPRRNNPRKTDTFNAKLWNLQKIANAQDGLNQQWEQSINLQVINRYLAAAKSQQAELFRLTPTWRFVVGLGDKTALEVGFTFHRIYGFPIIPGSSLKGLARAVALNEIADAFGVPRLGLAEAKKRAEAKDKNRHQQEKYDMPLVKLDKLLSAPDEKSEKKAIELLSKEKGLEDFSIKPEYQAKIAQFRQIFGTQHAAGEAVFFDAVPAAAPNLETDIMNVHYKNYYGDDKENPKVYPSDNDDPTPIPFLTVGQTPFWFAVGWRGERDQVGIKQARTWLETGLRDFGVGAKTAAGYGYFET